MSEIASNIVNVILPIFLVVGAVVLLDRRLALDAIGVSRLVIYVFTPALVFNGLANADFAGGEVEQLVAVAVLTSLGVTALAMAVARVCGFDRKLASAFVISSVLINAGNYGLPLNKFAFGTTGEERALIFFAVTVVISNTLGIYLASRGSVTAREALRNVLLVPLPYAAALGLAVNVGDVSLGTPLERAIDLASQAANPAMLAVLGIRLSQASIRRGLNLRIALLAAGMRLIISPLIALGLVLLLGMSGIARQVALTQAAMPTAVITSVLATEFGSDAEFVTSSILVSTLLSTITLSVLLTLIM